MSLYLALGLFVAGAFVVMKGGDWFVDAAGDIARRLGVPTFIIGATIVSLATTLPEMLVSVIAAMSGKTDMAVGNAVGSVTANTGLILAVTMMFMAVQTTRRHTGQYVILLLAAGILWMGVDTGALEPWAWVFLGILFVAFMVNNLLSARENRAPADSVVPAEGMGRSVGFFLLGGLGIVVGSEFLVNGGSAIATALGVPERAIAVTMVAIGTSLPELVTAITAIRKQEAALSVGNIIGANIIDLTLILPVCSLVSGRALPVSSASVRYDLPACFFVTLAAVLPLALRKKGSKIQGIILLLLYGAYLVLSL